MRTLLAAFFDWLFARLISWAERRGAEEAARRRGAAEEIARQQSAAAAAERAAAAVSSRDVAQTVDDLEKGRF